MHVKNTTPIIGDSPAGHRREGERCIVGVCADIWHGHVMAFSVAVLARQLFRSMDADCFLSMYVCIYVKSRFYKFDFAMIIST